jgi:hypothetical protein
MALTKTLGGGGSGITELTGDVTAGPGSGSQAATIATGAVDIAHLSATGTPSATTFLRGDNTWSTPSGSGTGRFWDVTAIPTDSAVQTARTLDFSTSPSIASFTWANQGTATAVIQRQRLYMTTPTGSAAHNKRVFFPTSTYQVPATTPWCVQVPVTVYATTAYNSAGIYIKNTTNGKGYAAGLLIRDDFGRPYMLNVVKMTNETTGSADLWNHAGFPKGVLAISYDGTTFKFWASPDGQDWAPEPNASEAASTFIGSGGTYQFGFYVDTFTSRQSGGAFNNSVILNQATPVPHGQFV